MSLLPSGARRLPASRYSEAPRVDSVHLDKVLRKRELRISVAASGPRVSSPIPATMLASFDLVLFSQLPLPEVSLSCLRH